MQTPAVLDRVSYDETGAALTAAAAVSATTLQVDEFIAEFNVAGGQLQVGGVTYTYLSADMDAQTITLATGLTVAVADGDPVYALTEAGELRAELLAYCRVTDDAEATPYRVDTSSSRYVTVDTPAGTGLWVDDTTRTVVGRLEIPTAPDMTGATNVPSPVESAQEAPGVSPVIEMWSYGGDTLVLSAPDAAPDTVLDWHLYAATAGELDFTPGPSTLLAASSAQNPYATKFLADGVTAVLPGVKYLGKALAVNAAGSSPTYSAVVAGNVAPLGTDNISGLSVSKLLAGDLTAIVALLGELKVGSNISITPAGGIVITQTNGKRTVIPADGSGPTFRGSAQFDSATFDGAVSIFGLTNFLNGLMTVANGVTDPQDHIMVTPTWNYTAAALGLNPRGMYDNASDWLTTESFFGTGNINSYLKSNGARTVIKSFTTIQPTGGVTKVGTTWYVMGQDANRDYGWYVYAYNSTWSTKTGEWAVPVNMPNGGAIGTDGTNVLIARVDAGGTLRITAHNPSNGTTGTTVSCGGWSGEITSLTRIATGFAATRFVVSNTSGIRVFDTSGNRITSEEWPRPGNIYGLSHDGTAWHSQDGDAKIYDYTNLTGSVDTAYDRRDTNSGGSYGTGRTKPSPRYQVALPRYARALLTAPDPQWDGTADGANGVGIYVGTVGGVLYEQAQVTAAPWSASIASLSTSGQQPATTSGFAARVATAGVLSSAALDAVSAAVWKLSGDGSGRGGPLTWDSAGLATGVTYAEAPGDSTHTPTTTTNVTVSGAALTITSKGTSEVWVIGMSADVEITTANSVNLVEVLVDGTAIFTVNTKGPAGTRATGYQQKRVTGLSAGTHAVTVRTRNSAAATGATVRGTLSMLSAERKIA